MGEQQDRSIHELARTIIEDAPEFVSRLRNCPTSSAKSPKPNMFYCHPDTNVWSDLHPVNAQGLITSKLAAISNVSASEARLIGSLKGRAALMSSVAVQVADETFSERLDRNLDLFAVKNGVFDSSTGSVVFRAIQPDDLISKTASWSYDPQAAAAHRPEVDQFMSSILPDDGERRVFLKYLATLLSGRRSVKRFIMLVDLPGLDWNTGKTTLANFIGDFFSGCRDVAGAQFMVPPHRLYRGNDVGLQIRDKVRLLIADGTSRDMPVDEEMLKSIINGPTAVSGRAFRTGRIFTYIWQAGIIMTCNAGGCPHRILVDDTLFERMLVIPMRTHFVSRDPVGANEVRVDHGINARFRDMLPALADILVEVYDNRDAAFSDDNIPASMAEMKESIRGGVGL